MNMLRRRIVIDESVTWSNLGDEVVLLNVRTGIYYGLDAIGTRIWGLLCEGASEDDVFKKMLTEYDVEPDRLSADLTDIIDQLVSKGLTRIADA